MAYSLLMMPTMNALLLDILAATVLKEEVTYSPTMMPMMSAINFH
jgi:hypothetical protein